MRCDWECGRRPVWSVTGFYREGGRRVGGTALVCDVHRDEAVADLGACGRPRIDLLAMLDSIGSVELVESWLDLEEEVMTSWDVAPRIA